jgi:alpha,alpha-trehalose phosphorylase
VTQQSARYLVDDGAPLDIAHHGTTLTVKPGEPQDRPIPPAPPRPRPTQPPGRAPAPRQPSTPQS